MSGRRRFGPSGRGYGPPTKWDEATGELLPLDEELKQLNYERDKKLLKKIKAEEERKKKREALAKKKMAQKNAAVIEQFVPSGGELLIVRGNRFPKRERFAYRLNFDQGTNASLFDKRREMLFSSDNRYYTVKDPQIIGNQKNGYFVSGIPGKEVQYSELRAKNQFIKSVYSHPYLDPKKETIKGIKKKESAVIILYKGRKPEKQATTISNQTKKQVNKQFGFDPNKIHNAVVPNEPSFLLIRTTNEFSTSKVYQYQIKLDSKLMNSINRSECGCYVVFNNLCWKIKDPRFTFVNNAHVLRGTGYLKGIYDRKTANNKYTVIQSVEGTPSMKLYNKRPGTKESGKTKNNRGEQKHKKA